VKLEHEFEVPASPRATLRLLLDADRVVPCMPGATLTEAVDERNWRAGMVVKLGPVSMEFDAQVRLLEIDEAAGTVKMEASGRDTRGKGGANATIDSKLTAVGSGTRVHMSTDLRFSGQAAQLGRPSVVQDVSERIVTQFADCIRAQLTATPEQAAAAVERTARPVSGLSLFLTAIKGALGRLFGRGKTQ
jgi:carbon monoxide dehydrogenase subunit G